MVGCHRSGTNLLYDNLLSAGGFAVYRGYLPVYKMLVPRFGRIDKAENRRRIVETWMRSKGFRRSGLDPEALKTMLLEQARSSGDFIRIVMDQISRAQGTERWAVYDPDNLLYIPDIKRDIPNALFLHIVRDGRDIAVSLKKMGGFRPIPWGEPADLSATALYWQWMVETGRHYGRRFAADYLEVRYEELVAEPQRTLTAIGRFLDHDLNYERIQSAGLGSLSESNSSFRGQTDDAAAQPVGRWRQKLSPAEVASLESLIGECLQDCGYSLTASAATHRPGLQDRWMRAFYPAFLSGKLWLKRQTPAGRWTSLAPLDLSDAAPGAESSAL